MGIPSLFRYLSDKYPKIIQHPRKISPTLYTFCHRTDVLHIDFNAVIHISTHPEDGRTPASEEEMFENINRNLQKLIQVVRPEKYVYISTDGVAPRAKINQQRGRRYVTAMGGKANLGEKAAPCEERGWDVNSITPGTLFMSSLERYITKAIQFYLSTVNPRLRILYSSDLRPGEGEHKILDFIRRGDPSLFHTIYSPDGDFIFLGLTLHSFRVNILREDLNYIGQFKRRLCSLCGKRGHADEDCGSLRLKKLLVVNIKLLREYFAKELQMKVARKFDVTRMIDDIVFVTFLAGNDFLPAIPCIDVRFSGIDYLLALLAASFEGQYITGADSVNLHPLKTFLRNFAKDEDSLYQRKKKALVEARIKFRVEDPRESIPLDTPPGKQAYYSAKMQCMNQKDIDYACTEYLRGCAWVYKYYKGGQRDWGWYYPFHYAPFACDLSRVVLEEGSLEFESYDPVNPLQQLMLVIPKESEELLPPVLRQVYDKFDDNTVSIDMFDKLFEWQGVVNISFIDINYCLNFYSENKEKVPLNFLFRNFTKNDTLFIGKNCGDHNQNSKIYERKVDSGSSKCCIPFEITGSKYGASLNEIQRLNKNKVFKNTSFSFDVLNFP